MKIMKKVAGNCPFKKCLHNTYYLGKIRYQIPMCDFFAISMFLLKILLFNVFHTAARLNFFFALLRHLNFRNLDTVGRGEGLRALVTTIKSELGGKTVTRLGEDIN